MKKLLILFIMSLMFIPNAIFVVKYQSAYANSDNPKYYTVYDKDNDSKVLFFRSDDVEKGDQYISNDNKLYEIIEVDHDKKVGYAKFKENVVLPQINVKRKSTQSSNKVLEPEQKASAKTKKVVGVYHTHNDESYNVGDGYDSVYGKGGIHDIGAKFVQELENCGMTVYYDETLHLPHNSGAYTRSQATASRLLNKGAQAIFDVHRDSTPRSEYITNVNGTQMSKIRMVIGSANANSAANKELALRIKAYADEVYPNFIKDIYIGKGNYNQQLTNNAMLFEFGAETLEKYLVARSAVPLARTLDVVLYGTQDASETALEDVDITSINSSSNSEIIKGTIKSNKGSLDALWVVLAVLGYISILFVVAFFTNKEFKYHVQRFFSEITAGIFGRKHPKRDL